MAKPATRSLDLVLHAAAELLAETGFGAMSMRQLAERSRLQPGSLYHHVTSKQDLLLDVLLEVLRQRLSAWHTGAFSRDLPGYLRFLLARQCTHPHEHVLLRHETRHLTPEQRQWLAQAQGQLHAPLQQFIDRALGTERARTDHKAWAGEAIVALVEAAHNMRRHPAPMDEAKIEAWLIRSSLALLGAHPGLS